MTRKASNLDAIEPEATVSISPNEKVLVVSTNTDLSIQVFNIEDKPKKIS